MIARAVAADAKHANAAESAAARPRPRPGVSLQQAAGNRALQRMAALRRTCGCGGGAESACACDVEKNVREGLSTPSQSMEPGLRRQMESHFGYDFGGVRIHTGEGAAASAHSVDAAAYTVGNHIVFGRGAYTPQVLAHELTHVVQQRGDATIPTRLGDPHDPLEHEAEAAAAHVSHDEGGALRRVPESKVGCTDEQLLNIRRFDPKAAPVADITAAEQTARSWLASIIAKLGKLLEGVAKRPAVPSLKKQTAKALTIVGIDPTSLDAWTGSGENSVPYLKRRLVDVRATIGTGKFYYHCDGSRITRVAGCAPAVGQRYVCDDAQGATCFGTFTTALCEPFWKYRALRAVILIHEALHHLDSRLGHQGRDKNIFCYERTILTLLSNPNQYLRSGPEDCPDP